ncbi:putative glycoprotein hormone G-protein coupled receptor [Exaiptasia diaphana]|nr:putative glycoprotein hormone G-protein coupled receptor [Exaiptasia diaphana]
MFLDVTGNFPWIPTVNVLAITSLREIKGVTWNSDCVNCTLTNSRYSTGMEGTDDKGSSPNISTVETTQITVIVNVNDTAFDQTGISLPGNPSSSNHLKIDHSVPNMFVQNSYFPNCLHVPVMMKYKCFPGKVVPPKTKHLLKIPSQLFYIAYVLGALGIVLNCSIIVIYMYSTNIRKINSMLLISNMAFCDILVGVYAIIIAKYNIFTIMLSRGDVMPNSVIIIGSFCKVASVLFTVGQVVSVITALLLTIDKFLSIVYCMDPNRKLSRRLSLLVLFLCWVGVIVYAFSPEFSVMSYSPALLCTFPVTEMKVFIISVCLLVAFYLANIPLQRQFRREFKKCMRSCILSRFCKAISTIRTDSSVRNTQPTRVEMYKLSNIDSQTQGM